MNNNFLKTNVTGSTQFDYYQSSTDNIVYVSQNFSDLINQFKYRYIKKTNINLRYHYYYFVSSIYYLSSWTKQFKNDEYVPINYKVITNTISKKYYSEIKNNLIAWGVIESDNSYQVGEKSTGYKLTEKYLQDMKRLKIQDETINEKLNDFHNDNFKKINMLPFAYRYLGQQLNRLVIDEKKAIELNDSRYYQAFIKGENKKHSCNYFAISSFACNDLRHIVCKYNRFHSNLTNMNKLFRNFLTVDGETLISLDVKNSQPMFFYLHIKGIKQINEAEKQAYKSLVETGDFYYYFLRSLGIPETVENKNKFKTQILVGIFFDEIRTFTNRYQKVFKKDFPTISQYIKKFKQKDFSELPKMLQKLEAKYIIEYIVQKFGETTGFEFIATIHDSIIVKEKYKDVALQIINDIFFKAGINPEMDNEVWNNDNLKKQIIKDDLAPKRKKKRKKRKSNNNNNNTTKKSKKL